MLHVLCQHLPGHHQHHPQLQVTGGREHVRQGVRSPTRLQRSIVVHVSDLRRCDVLEVIGQGVGHPPPLEEPRFQGQPFVVLPDWPGCGHDDGGAGL